MTTTQLGSYRLALNTDDGTLAYLAYSGGLKVLGHGTGPTLPSVDIGHQSIQAKPRFLQSTSGETLTSEIAVGPLTLFDSYRVVDGLLERRVRVRNISDSEVQLTGLRIGLPGAAIGEPAQCLFEAPANAVRPRMPLSVAASQPLPEATLFAAGYPQYDPLFGPAAAYLWGRTIADAPDVGPGLLVVHNPAESLSLLTWYVSDVEAARPWVSGDGTHATLGFDVWLAGWLAPGASLEAGTQYILIHEGSYNEALAAYVQRTAHSGLTPPIYGPVDRAADWSAVYEVHPGQFGGFDGLTEALPRIADLGVDTVYLLPVYAHRNKTGSPWDENWEGIGSPYAIHDFYELEPSLGTAADFQRLVDAAHDLGMRVLLDLVLQGSALESRYVEEHPEWYARDQHGEMVHSHGWNDTWSFDWANPDYQRFVLDYTRHYVETFDIDGFRVDAPHGKEPNWDRSLDYHASRTNLGTARLLADLREMLLEIKPEAALYCELFGPLWIHSHEISNDYHPHAMVYQLFENRITPHEFNEYLRDYWAIMPRAEDGTPSPRICFTETHDTRAWPVYALRGSLIAKAMLSILVMAGFTPMIWAGQEEGQEDFLRGLFGARRDHTVLRRGTLLYNRIAVDDENHYRRHGGDEPDRMVHTLLRHDDETVVFSVVSLLPEKATFRLSLPLDNLPVELGANYALVDLISGERWTEHGKSTWRGAELASFHLSLGMYQPHILKLTKT